MLKFLCVLLLISGVKSTYYCYPPSVPYTDGFCLTPGGIDTFYNAQLRCINMGGFLPSIPDESANKILLDQTIVRDSCTGTWIGLDERGVWTDGTNLTYTNWDIPGGDWGEISNCVQFNKTNGMWKEEVCSVRMGFSCITPANTYPLTTLPYQCNYSPAEVTPPTTNFPCKFGYCPGHWRIVVMVAANSQVSYDNALEVMNTVTTKCGSSDEVFFMSPGKLETNVTCHIDTLYSGYFASVNKTYPFSYVDEDATGDAISKMLESSQSCLKAKPLDSKRGGVLYLLTDMDCSRLCTTTLVHNQSMLLTSMIEMGYVVQIVKLSTSNANDCVSKVFNQCDHLYDSCNIVTMSSASSNEVCEPYHLPGAIIAVIVSVSVLLLIAIVAAIVIRYYLKKHGGWNQFWKNMAEQRRNSHFVADATSYDEWEILPENLEIQFDKQLGSGAFGIVYEGVLNGKRPVDSIIPTAKLSSGNSNGKVAVKRVPAHADLLSKREFEDEVRFMKTLGYHSHVLGMIGCLLNAELPLMVLELCENGDLLDFVRSHRDSYSIDGSASLRPKDLISLSWQISDGLCYLKSLDLIHRDLAARNILLTKDLVAKISDFGLCRQAETSDSASIYISRGGRLPVKWMAPESLRDFKFSFQTDVWSFGIVLWEMFTLGENPFADVNATTMLETLEEGARLGMVETIPETMYSIMSSCWPLLPDDRKQIEDLRDEIADLLTANANYYGYVALSTVAQIGDDVEINRTLTVLSEHSLDISHGSNEDHNSHKSHIYDEVCNTELLEVVTTVRDRFASFRSRRSRAFEEEKDRSQSFA